jgi:short subunit dehydrogenase-like uncharacterized protein
MLLIYGATGYTARLIIGEALARGLRPVLGGRNEQAVRALAEGFTLEWRAASLDDAHATDAALRGITVVLNCAGPFIHTWRAMSDACLRNRAHYLDITGEIAVFENLFARDAEARRAGIMLLPGAGFDVVPSDCLAAHLAQRVPNAEHLALGFVAAGGASRGTLSTIIENLGAPGAVRRKGRIIPVPAGWRMRRIDFGDGTARPATTIPWGDVSTAFHSTGIPNIEVYITMSPGMRRALVASRFIAPVLRMNLVRRALRNRVRNGPAGPDAAARGRTRSMLWGEVVAPDGRSAESVLHGPDGYTLTAMTSVLLALKALSGNAPTGFQTPSRAYGSAVIMEIPGIVRTDAERA